MSHFKNIKINQSGELLVQRGKQLVSQYCFMAQQMDVGELYACGHDCSLFGEPYFDTALGHHVLELCRKTLYCSHFDDER